MINTAMMIAHIGHAGPRTPTDVVPMISGGVMALAGLITMIVRLDPDRKAHRVIRRIGLPLVAIGLLIMIVAPSIVPVGG